MKKHSFLRKFIVTSIFFIVLVIIAPFTILYSLGYRFNNESKVFVHSGSVVLKTTPFNVNIALSGENLPQKSIDLINRSYNINGLAPGSYAVEVSASGYNSWKKQTEVHSGIATEFWNVVLVPQNVERKTLTEDNILKYSFSPDKQKIAYFTGNSEHVSLFVQEGIQNTLVYEEPMNQKFSPSAGELKWSSNNQYLIFSVKKDNKEEILIASANQNYADIIPIGQIFQKSVANLTVNNESVPKTKKTNVLKPISAYSWDDQGNIYFVYDGQIFYEPADEVFTWWSSLVSEQNLNNNNSNNNKSPGFDAVLKKYAKNPEKLILTGDNAPQKVTDKDSGFTFCGRYICYLNTESKTLAVVNQKGEEQARASLPENYEVTKKYQIFAYSDELVAVLDDNGNLFIWDNAQNKKEGADGMKFIFAGVKEVYFSDDGKKLLFATKNETYVYFVREWEVQPKHLVGDLNLIWSQPDDLVNVQWYLDYQNILVVNKDRVTIVELDDRGGRNAAVFLEGQDISNAGYDTVERKFWFTEKGDGSLLKLQEVAFPATTGLLSGIMNSENKQ